MLQGMSDDIRLRYHPGFLLASLLLYMPCIYTLHLFEVIVVLGSFIDLQCLCLSCFSLSHPLCLYVSGLFSALNTKPYSLLQSSDDGNAVVLLVACH